MRAFSSVMQTNKLKKKHFVTKTYKSIKLINADNSFGMDPVNLLLSRRLFEE
jgi:hypothetical protein